MASFSDRIIALVGSDVSQTHLDMWCTEGAKEIINAMPMPMLKLCTTDVSFTSAAVGAETETLNTGKILSVFAGAYEARPINNALKHKASDADSIEYATATDPVFYIENGMINVLPDSLAVKYEEVSYPDVDASTDTTLTNKTLTSVTCASSDGVFTKALHGLNIGNTVTLSNFQQVSDDVSYSAINNMTTQIATTPNANTFTVEGVVAGAITTDLDNGIVKLHGGFPDEAEYLIVLYAAMKALQNQMNASTVPADIVPPVLFNMTSSLPTYTAPSSFVLPVSPANANVDFSSVPSTPSFDISVFTEPSYPTINTMNLPTPPLAPSLSTASVAGLGTAPAYVPPVMSLDFADADTNWLTTEEDSEMVRSKVEIIQAQIQEYQARSTDSLNQFNKDKAVYDASLSKILQDSKLADAAEGRKIQTYQMDVTKYSAEVTKEVQRWQNEEYNVKMQEWVNKYSNRLQEYSQKITEKNAKVTSELTIWKEEMMKAIQQFQSESGYDVSLYQGQIQSETSRFQSDLTKQSELYKSDVENYNSELRKITEANQSVLAKFGTEIQNVATQMDKVAVQYKWKQNEYQTIAQDYAKGIQLLATGDSRTVKQPSQQQQQPPQQGGY